jgi:indolepyruvate ferredoxin oxidoreductase beta subunit
VVDLAAPAAAASTSAVGTPTAAPIAEAIELAFPAAAQPVVALGHARLVEYQDADYATLYLQRLDRVREAERAGDPAGALAGETTKETARWLALWMAFDDIVRVAQLKLRAARFERVRREVGAEQDEVVRIYDHFKPGVAEFAALLPAPLATRLLAWDEGRRRRGLDSWSMPLQLATHAPTGALALRLLGGLTGWRRRGSRFATEQQLIERWLAAVERGAREHGPLGLELARCGRLVKGYGSTNERGKRNLLHLIDHQAAGDAAPASRADVVRAAREAALADDAGRAFDRTLVTNGLPARPVVEQPIRFVRRRPAAPLAQSRKEAQRRDAAPTSPRA